MISGFTLILFFLWFVSAITDYSQFCYIWQLKEYRKDRFRDFLYSEQGKQFWMQYPLFWRSLLAVTIFFWPINSVLLLKYIVSIIFAGDTLLAILKLKDKRFFRPRITVKSALIVILALSVEGLIILGTHDWAVLFPLLILRFFLLSSIVGVVSYPTTWYKSWKIYAARKKLARFAGLKIIGITGSYGKSSTKEFLSYILSEKYHVIKTPKNINTEIGIANFILRTDFTSYDYFVVEMGAYAIGEIAVICDMVRPTYGILTTIAEEHLALFGSIKNIQQGKYELLRALPVDGFAVTNADNAFCREYLSELQVKNVSTFGFDEEYAPTALITHMDREKGNIGISFSLLLKGAPYVFSAPIIGEHNTQNISAALLMAEKLGMTIKEIQKRVMTLSAEHGVIRIYNYGKATIVDDTYNSNPNGFRAALTVLAPFSGKKKRIVITRGMLELGSLSEDKHEEIGGEIVFSADELVIISPDSADALERGAVKKYGITIVRIFEPQRLLNYFQELKDQDVIVLLENRVPQNIVEEIAAHQTYVTSA